MAPSSRGAEPTRLLAGSDRLLRWTALVAVGLSQCHAGVRLGVWLVGSVSFVDSTLSAGPRTRGTGRRGLIGAWLRPH